MGTLDAILGETRTGTDTLEAWVRRLDEHNLTWVSHSHMEWIQDRARVVELINEETSDLPRLTPLRERTLLFMVRLQIRMLEKRVARRNPEELRTLSEHRTRRRVLDPQRHYAFGDVRDEYVAHFFFALKDLDRIYQILGIPTDPLLEFPSGLNSVGDLETFFSARIRYLLEHAPG